MILVWLCDLFLFDFIILFSSEVFLFLLAIEALLISSHHHKLIFIGIKIFQNHVSNAGVEVTMS